MPQQQAPDGCLDDVQVLGTWNLTLQGDTPLHWLRTGQLDRYLLKLRVTSPCPCTCGLVLHAEVDGPGTDGVSFWIERRPGSGGGEGSRRYMLAGDGLESKPIATRSFPDAGGRLSEEVEVLMEGYQGAILLQDRKVSLRFRLRHAKGSIAFYNSTAGEDDDVHFGSARITALRRGPLEIDGRLLNRERELSRLSAEGRLFQDSAEASVRSPSRALQTGSLGWGGGFAADSMGSTAAPASFEPSLSLAPGGLRSSVLAPAAAEEGAPSFRRTFPGQSVSEPRAAPSRQLPSPAGRSGRASTPGTRSTPKARLRGSASHGSLQLTGARGSPSGSTSAGPLHMARGQGQRRRPPSESWVPLALNAPAGEQELLKSISRPRPATASGACNDFIPLSSMGGGLVA